LYSFDKVEVKFNLDEAGEPQVFTLKFKDANHLIEEFMLWLIKSSRIYW
jgi:ribonuclease R